MPADPVPAAAVPPSRPPGPAAFYDELIRSFVHTAANEFAAAVGFAELLADPELSGRDRVRTQRELGQLLLRLVPLLDDLSNQNELEQGRYTPVPEPINLQKLVGTAVDALQADWPARWVDLSFAPGLPAALADAIDTSRIVAILLRNAANYTSGDIFVRLRFEAATAQVCVTVADKGPAWPADWHELVFARLAALPAVRREWPRHTLQLGLYVARHWARYMGGDLQLEPNGSGGNDFRLSLPIEPSAR
jgi:signal transduction histidine kinase